MLNIPKDFFKEEIRDGYTISEMMKRSWATQMKILESLKVLMDKYSLHYFADLGTLLGAVRHGGYIPWDDDLDISMPREDYMILLEHADEIEDGLYIRSIYNSDTYMNFHAVVTHKADVLKWDSERTKKNYGCPFICYVDIFPWDYIPSNEDEAKAQKQLFSYSYMLAYDLKSIEDEHFNGRVISLNDIKNSCFSDSKNIAEFILNYDRLTGLLPSYPGNNHIDADKPLRKQLLILADKAAQMCPEEAADRVDYCSRFAASSADYSRKKDWQNSFVELPFEFTTIKAPVDYKNVLISQYGENYMVPQRYASDHDYPFYRDEVRVLINGDTGDVLSDVPAKEPSVEAIPEYIRQILINENGGLKRTIIYGLSATDIITGGHRSLEVIREFIAGQKKRKDTVVAVFAPVHLREFMGKCQLEMYQAYCTLMDEIGGVENVILDENPNVDFLWSLISICDEYIGDECRLADICRKYEIPVSIQDYQYDIDGQKVTFPREFFYDEVRNGFLVSEMMKRFWAAQLIVLNEIDKVCRRHNINWFADMGTLIGAVRHHGYIPWDDDLDISMLRDDYEMFLRYAQNELPKGYMVLDVNSNPEYDVALGRVTNGPSINTASSHMSAFAGCPYVVGVDIFPIDKIFPDSFREETRKNRAKEIYNREGRYSKMSVHEAALLYDKVCRECTEASTEAAYMYPWIMAGKMNWDIEGFRDITTTAFENISIKIPRRYDELLTKEYGDYMTIKKGGGMHDYPVYHVQEELLREKIGHNPYRYTLDKNVLVRRMDDVRARRAKRDAGGNGEVLFMPCRESWWKTMKPMYDMVIGKDCYKVSVIPIPYYDCDYEGNIGTIHYEKEWAGCIKGVTDFDHYNLAERHPSKIIIQVPFDGWSCSMTVHERLYSDKLLNDCDELIYIPFFEVDPPNSGDDKIISAMRPIIEQPAVVNADCVVVDSAEMKVLYVETLTDIAGEDTRRYWENKICLIEDIL